MSKHIFLGNDRIVTKQIALGTGETYDNADMGVEKQYTCYSFMKIKNRRRISCRALKGKIKEAKDDKTYPSLVIYKIAPYNENMGTMIVMTRISRSTPTIMMRNGSMRDINHEVYFSMSL